MESKKAKAQYAAPAVDRTLDIVEFLSGSQGSFGINELARRLAIPVNGAYRVLKRLEERGYVECDPATQGFKLSSKLFSLGMKLHASFDLRKAARPHLEALAEEIGETVQMHVPKGGMMLVLDCVFPDKPYYLHVEPGSLLQWHADAFGKAVFAFSPDGSDERLRKLGLKPLTDRTLTDWRVLAKELEEVRASGLAYDREEYARGICCIGAPVFGALGEALAGIGATGLASRPWEGGEERTKAAVLNCARAISKFIGYDGPFFEGRGLK